MGIGNSNKPTQCEILKCSVVEQIYEKRDQLRIILGT